MRTHLLAIPLIGLLACGVFDVKKDNAEVVVVGPHVTTITPISTTSTNSSPNTVVDEQGVEWTVREVSQEYRDPTPTEPNDESTLSDEVVADRHRLVKLVPGKSSLLEYTQVKADVAAVHEARARMKAGSRLIVTDSGWVEEVNPTTPPILDAGVVFSLEKQAASTLTLQEGWQHQIATNNIPTLIPNVPMSTKNINLPGDDRGYIRPSDRGNWPSVASVQLELVSNLQSVCSGTMIGLNTMMSAAHCFHSGSSSGVYLPSTQWNLDRVHYNQLAGPPLNTYVNYDYKTLGPYTCWYIYLPTGWTTGSSPAPESYDYAIIDFTSCGFKPGSYGGYAVPTYGFDGPFYAGATFATIFGYDTELGTIAYPPGFTYPTDEFQEGTLIYRQEAAAGTLTLDANLWSLNFSALDVGHGASGSGLLAQLSGNWFWLGNVIG